MLQFLTISPTHVPGKKPYAWKSFLYGGYIAIGWMDIDLTGLSEHQINDLIIKNNYRNRTKGRNEDMALISFRNFKRLEVGDIVAVNNVNFGLFGIGRVTSGYKYKYQKHDNGSPDPTNHYYSHYRDVNWIIRNYLRREEILRPGEKGWNPYGATGKLEPELPDYIKRLLGKHESF